MATMSLSILAIIFLLFSCGAKPMASQPMSEMCSAPLNRLPQYYPEISDLIRHGKPLSISCCYDVVNVGNYCDAWYIPHNFWFAFAQFHCLTRPNTPPAPTPPSPPSPSAPALAPETPLTPPPPPPPATPVTPPPSPSAPAPETPLTPPPSPSAPPPATPATPPPSPSAPAPETPATPPSSPSAPPPATPPESPKTPPPSTCPVCPVCPSPPPKPEPTPGPATLPEFEPETACEASVRGFDSCANDFAEYQIYKAIRAACCNVVFDIIKTCDHKDWPAVSWFVPYTDHCINRGQN